MLRWCTAHISIAYKLFHMTVFYSLGCSISVQTFCDQSFTSLIYSFSNVMFMINRNEKTKLLFCTTGILLRKLAVSYIISNLSGFFFHLWSLYNAFNYLFTVYCFSPTFSSIFCLPFLRAYFYRATDIWLVLHTS